jgi:membrane-associated protease RseP (regulator of RpoE activity)
MTHTTDAAAMVGALFASAGVMNVTFLASARVLARWARVAATKAALGFGPRLFSVPFGDAGGAKLEVRLIPLNAFVQFAGANPYSEDPPPPPPLVLWSEAPVLRRIVGLVLPSRIVALGLAAALLGPSRACIALVEGCRDAFAAFYGAGPLLDRAAAIFANEGFVTLSAVTMTKCLAMQLWLAPSDILMFVGEPHAKSAAKVRGVMLLLSFVYAGAWLVALVRWAM